MDADYKVKLEVFEGPLDLLLHLIKQDEIDIYDISLERITSQYLEYLQAFKELNIELAGEFIVMAANLIYLKSRSLLPRDQQPPEEDAAEDDPRWELIRQLIEYKKFKEASAQMAEMEANRMLMVKRGNLQKELSKIGEEAAEGTEIQTVTMFRLMRAFERVMQRYHDTKNKPVHTVIRYEYTMEGSRDYMLSTAQEEKTLSFEKIFGNCDNRVHAIFLFLSLLELVQQKFLKIVMGEGKNNFIIEYNEPENRLAEMEDQIQP